MPRAKSGVTGRDRWRLWLLALALGFVLVLMRQLGQPGTVRRIERVFGNPQSSADRPTPSTDVVVQGEYRTESLGDSVRALEQNSGEEFKATGDLSAVKDNTYFLPEERKAWFSLFAKLQQMDEAQLSRETVGEVSYAQLLQQPDVYRGRVVTIQGKVLREESQQPADNQLGIQSYHRLTIAPRGGGQWPFVAYCLSLPNGFPRGDQLSAQVSVTGFFFKNWSYAHDDGLGLAPVVLASGPQWEKPPSLPAANQVSSRHWAVGVSIALVFALLVTWQVVRQTRRSGRRTSADQSVRDELQQLAGRESGA